MASTLSRRKGLGAPRRNNGAGSSGPTPFSAREAMSHTNGAPHGTGVWGTGRLERSLPSGHHHSAVPSSSHHHQHHQQPLQHNNYNASSAKDGYRAACRDRWINTSKTMMGERAEVAMSSGCIYEGVIHVLTPSGPTPGGSRSMYQVIMRAARVKSGGDRINSNANTDHQGGTLVLAGEDIVSISVKRFPMQQHAAQRPAGLGTDAEIGNRTTGGNGGNRAGERRLQKVDTSWVSGTEDLSLKGGAGKWDQFAANERLFNVKSTFDENLYTTPLDKTSLSRKQMADAERMAAEIESKSSNNIHIREERNMLTEQDKVMGEEERFSGVLGTGGLSHQTKTMSSSGTNGGTGRDASGPRYSSPRDRGGPYSAVAVSNAGDGGGGTGVYVPPALRPPNSGGLGGATMPAQNDRGSAPSGVSLSTRSSKQMQGHSAADAEAAARSEEAKEAAKAQLMDVLDGKLRSTSPKGANSSLKTGGALNATPAAAVVAVKAAPVTTTPKKNPAKPGSAVTPPLTSETVVATPSPPAKTETTGTATAPSVSDAPVGKAAGLSARKIVSTSAPPFVPAANRVPAPAPSSFATMRPHGAVSPASKPPPAVANPPLATLTSTAKTDGGIDKKKSSLRASAKEWRPNPAAPEWKPATSFAPTASPETAPTTAPASIQVTIPQTPTQAQAPVAARTKSPSPRGGGGGSGFDVGVRGGNPGGSVGFGEGVDHGGEYGHVSHMHQHVHPQQQQSYHSYSHHHQQQPSHHTHGTGGIAQQQIGQQQQHVPQHIPPPPQQLTSPHSSRHTSPHASPHSSQHRQQPHQQQPHHQHGSQHQQQQHQQPAQGHHQAQQPQQSHPQHPSQHRPQQPQQQPPPQPQQQQQHQTLPGGSLLPAGSPVAQGGASQMVVPSYPSGSMPAQIAAAAAVGGGAPHHMAAVPSHLMGGAPHGPMQSQQYPQPLYRTPSMGHHPHQMYMQQPPAGMRMPMAPGQLQGYPQQGMHMMGQPGNPMPPPGSPFFHGQMQMPQQQQQLPPPQVSVQQGQPQQQQQQQPRGFPMLQGHPGTGPAPGPPHTPPQAQRPGMMGMGGGVHGGGRMGGGNSPHDHGGDGGQGDDMVGGGHSRRGRGGRGSRGGGLSRQNSASRKHRGGSSG